jgi:hypothetical protein
LTLPSRAQLEDEVVALTAKQGSHGWLANEGFVGDGGVSADFHAGPSDNGSLTVQVRDFGSAGLCSGYIQGASCVITRRGRYELSVTRTPNGGNAHGIDDFFVVVRVADGAAVEVAAEGGRVAGKPAVPLTLQQTENLAKALADRYL